MRAMRLHIFAPARLVQFVQLLVAIIIGTGAAATTAGCNSSGSAASYAGARSRATSPAASATPSAAASAEAPAAASGEASAAASREASAAASAEAPVARASTESTITVPSGTHLRVVLDTPVGSDISRVEERVAAHLAKPVVVRGRTVLPSGSDVGGVVTDATRSPRGKGRAHIAVRFDSVSPPGENERYAIHTTAVGRTAPGTRKKDAIEIGAPAAGGALIGALVGGKKGALIGTAAGAGAGTAVVLSARGREVRLNKGAVLTLRLSEPLTVKVKS